MRKKRLIKNTISSLVSKIIAIICAFILPRLILQNYGTQVNGLVSSISQFLTIISLTEFGITAVVQSSLYKPLAYNDIDNISKIMASSSKFFKKISNILILYVVILCVLYPILVDNTFGFWYTATLIVAMSINSLVQYLFGITKSQLISADQKLYIINNTETFINIINTIVCSILVYNGVSIQLVKFITVLIYIIKPIIYSVYVKKNYNINYKINYDVEPIQQKWNGVAQHISYYILNSTDIIVLTLFSNLENVSIYTIYKLVLSGIHQLFSIFENLLKPLFGEFWALEDNIKLKKYFTLYEWFINTVVCFIFGCTLTLIVPFIQVYTNGINDANYIVPSFAVIFTLGYTIQNVRNPYNILIMSVGHYKQTQKNHILTASINIFISLILVYKFGLLGVAIGTFLALFYQTCWQAWYVYKYILQNKIIIFIKQLFIDILILTVGYLCSNIVILKEITYINWIIMALKVSIIWIIVVFIINIIFYKKNIDLALSIITKDKIKEG